MKQKTKKTIIIVLAIAIIAVIVWLLFFRKQGYEKEIDKLNASESVKAALRDQVKQGLKDPNFNKSEIEAQAAQYGMTYDQWLVCLAAMALGYQPTSTNGVISITYPYA